MMRPSRREFFGAILGLGSFVRQPRGGLEPQNKLIDTVNIAGYRYYDCESVERTLRRGSRLVLVRDPFNEYDANAVEVLLPSSEKLGFLPMKRNAVAAFLLDSGVEVGARVREVRPGEGPWERVRIDIFAPAVGGRQPQQL